MERQTKLNCGVYKVYWVSGGMSLASVGRTYDGTNWYAPCNWTSDSNTYPGIASTNWNIVSSVEIFSLQIPKDDNYKERTDYGLSYNGGSILSKTLHLTLERKWFDMIASGEKKEEYREIKPYWSVRLMSHIEPPSKVNETFYIYNYRSIPFDIISATNGCGPERPNIKWRHMGTKIGEGRPEWGAEPGRLYFILMIGEIINK